MSERIPRMARRSPLEQALRYLILEQRALASYERCFRSATSSGDRDHYAEQIGVSKRRVAGHLEDVRRFTAPPIKGTDDE